MFTAPRRQFPQSGQKYNENWPVVEGQRNNPELRNSNQFSPKTQKKEEQNFDQDKWFHEQKLASADFKKLKSKMPEEDNGNETNSVCSELYDCNFTVFPDQRSKAEGGYDLTQTRYEHQPKMPNGNVAGQWKYYQPSYMQPKKNLSNGPLRFTEKHLIESLNVFAVHGKMPVMFYNMLNQGNKRGKETQVLSLDCERILTDKGEQLARVSIVNYYGNIVFDTLVKPCMSHEETFEVVDYREWITGIKPIDLQHAPSFGNIAPIIQKIVKGKTIVGHSLLDDFKILKIDIDHSEIIIRDISNINLFMQKIDKDSKSPLRFSEDQSKSPQKLRKINLSATKDQENRANTVIQKRKLKDLAGEFLNAEIQNGHHSSIIDARTALALYRMNYEEIEINFRCHEALKEVQKKNTKMEIENHNLKMKLAEEQLQKIDLKISNTETLIDSKTDLTIFKEEQIKNIEFLMKTKPQIFNVTPPNAKDEGKFSKNMESMKTYETSGISELTKIDPFSASNLIFSGDKPKNSKTDFDRGMTISQFKLD